MIELTTKKRGRKPKDTAEATDVVVKAPKKRGRPRKNPLPEEAATTNVAATTAESTENTAANEATAPVSEAKAPKGKKIPDDVKPQTVGIKLFTQKETFRVFEKINKDVKAAAATLNDQEARYLVDTYYQFQEQRIRATNQCRALATTPDGEPHETLKFFASNFAIIEQDLKKVLEEYAKGTPIGQWLLSICGIGPVIAAGLIANIDITKVQAAGQIQRFAGLDPTSVWEKGQKRPWNAKLKVLCWKIGQSFVKVQNNEKDIYGKLYVERKRYEQEKNERHEYADQAKAKLENCRIGKETDAYKWYSQGMLPPAHIEQRAQRWAVKIFLSHLFEVWYTMYHNERPPKPYAIAQLGHAHKIEPPKVDEINQFVVACGYQPLDLSGKFLDGAGTRPHTSGKPVPPTTESADDDIEDID